VHLATLGSFRGLRLAKDGKEVGEKTTTSPSAAGASGAEPTPDMLAGALMNRRKTLRREVRVCT
jgi:hypothetical protein